LHANSFSGICIGDKLTSNKYAKTINILWTVKVFVKYQAHGGTSTPTPPLRTPLVRTHLFFHTATSEVS